MLYTASFLRTMKAKIRAKRHLYDGRLDVAAALRARTFTEYDRFFTAPINGFADERRLLDAGRAARPISSASAGPRS